MTNPLDKKIRQKVEHRVRAHQRLRQRVSGTTARPRLAVFKSSRYVYAQLINDEVGQTLVAATSLEPALKAQLGPASGGKAAAKLVGQTIAERALAKGIATVVFDRGGYVYHGKVKELADAARAKGLKF